MVDEQATPLQRAIREAIEASGKSRDALDAELRKILSTTGKPLWDIDRGKSKRPAADRLRVIERVLHLPPDRLVDLVYPRESGQASPDAAALSDTVAIHKLDLSLSMGPGTLIDDYVEAEPVTFDLAFVRSITRAPSDRLRLVTGIGDSMYPTLNWGDVIMIDTTDRALARQDGIYWINVYGAAGIKRLRTVGQNRVLVKSDNPAVDDQEVDAEDLRIEGRAIWVARGL